jgi:hypothetical protein
MDRSEDLNGLRSQLLEEIAPGGEFDDGHPVITSTATRSEPRVSWLDFGRTCISWRCHLACVAESHDDKSLLIAGIAATLACTSLEI